MRPVPVWAQTARARHGAGPDRTSMRRGTSLGRLPGAVFVCTGLPGQPVLKLRRSGVATGQEVAAYRASGFGPRSSVMGMLVKTCVFHLPGNKLSGSKYSLLEQDKICYLF